MQINDQIAKLRIDQRLLLKIIIALNLFMGLILWFGYFTDYSFVGTFPNLVFPLLVALLAALTLIFGVRKADVSLKRRYKNTCLPSLIGGGIPVLITLIMLFPPFTLGFLFAYSEISNERQIQSVTSPDNTRIASVYFRGVGAYDQGNGRVFIRVGYRWLPLVERDLDAISPSYADENTFEYIRWKDNNTLEIIGEPESKEPIERQLKVGIIRINPHVFVTFPLALIVFFFINRKKRRPTNRKR